MRTDSEASLPELLRQGVLDAELAAVLWLLAESGVPIHVAAPDVRLAGALAAALGGLAREPAVVSVGAGRALEDVLRIPVPLRPATGVVVVLDERRVVAAHFQRPPLRDAGGHIRPQGPAVLATWDGSLGDGGGWEHFAWGVTPELAAAADRKAGDFESEQVRRREFLEALAADPARSPDAVRSALAAWAGGGPRQ